MEQTIKNLYVVFREFVNDEFKKVTKYKYSIGNASTRILEDVIAIDMNVYLESQMYDYSMTFLIKKSDLAIVTDSYKVIDFDFILDNVQSFAFNNIFNVTPKSIGIHTLETI